MVSVVPQDGRTPFIFAVQYHRTEIVKTLMAARADVNLLEKVQKTIYIDVDACVYHSILV